MQMRRYCKPSQLRLCVRMFHTKQHLEYFGVPQDAENLYHLLEPLTMVWSYESRVFTEGCNKQLIIAPNERYKALASACKIHSRQVGGSPFSTRSLDSQRQRERAVRMPNPMALCMRPIQPLPSIHQVGRLCELCWQEEKRHKDSAQQLEAKRQAI